MNINELEKWFLLGFAVILFFSAYAILKNLFSAYPNVQIGFFGNEFIGNFVLIALIFIAIYLIWFYLQKLGIKGKV